MRVDRVIKGEKISYHVKFLLNQMKAEVRFWYEDEAVIGEVTQDFKKIILPDTFLTPYITNHGKVPVKYLKLNRYLQSDAKEYNTK